VPQTDSVSVRITEEVIPTYLPAPPDKHPMFLEKRVYQGSSGKVYPLPFTDRIAETKTDRAWKAVWLENEYLRVMILPEIGGRIHVAQDKTNGYDFIYRQTDIKPALVGLAGPWISGGIEFNWPQHHRPATFLPVDFHVEEHPDGSKTVWLSDHDPMERMKGMHGVCLHPGKALIELKVRAYNRTPLTQTFLWWANVATRVHEAYQSFFPPDVSYVADHAKRAMSEYPFCQGHYYGVNYGERGRRGVPVGELPNDFVPLHCPEAAKGTVPFSSTIAARRCPQKLGQSLGPVQYAPNDLSWYANIPVPTSYMCMGSHEDFFGGYDHSRQAGIVHVADHHIAPGKKQWTWGNHEFGCAWDRNLTDSDGPYIELMAGVYTDNQPDFSFLQPGETKTWSQFWYPIQKIGPPQHANVEAAVSLCVEKRTARVGVSVSAEYPKATITLTKDDRIITSFTRDLAPGDSLVEEIELPPRVAATDLRLRVADAAGREIIAYQPKPRKQGEVPPPAVEPPPPGEIRSADELFITGLHLSQYRHATRCPTLYWREALRRDPNDSRCNNAMGLWHLRRGELDLAESCFRRAIERLTLRNPNPADGEAFYNLGLCLRHQIDAAFDSSRESTDELFQAAYSAFYKATWNQAWAAAGFHALAEMNCRRGEWSKALEHLDRSLRFDADNLRARDLKAIVLRKLQRDAEADRLLKDTLTLDPLDWWARRLAGQTISCDVQTRLDLAYDFARAGLIAEAIAELQNIEIEKSDLPTQSWGTLPMVDYTLGWLHQRLGDDKSARACCKHAASRPPDYCFPGRLEEIAILQSAMRSNPRDARAPYYLGNLLYDRRRHEEALVLWERSVKLDPSHSIAWRNLGIGSFNIRKSPEQARKAYEKAFRADPSNARLLFERDQLWKCLGESPSKRLRELEKRLDLVRERDDLTISLCALYNQTGEHAKAIEMIVGRKFQPWEGGEGQSLGQYVRSRIALGRQAMNIGNAAKAREHFEAAAATPRNLGECRHLLANQSDVHYWLGCALDALGEKEKALQHWRTAATFEGDFQEMSVIAFSEMSYYSALAWERLGRKEKAQKLWTDLLAYAVQLQKSKPTIPYFATSLPTMLLFEDDLESRQTTAALFLQAQARLGLGQKARAKKLLDTILQRDPDHALASDLMASINAKESERA
jgi:tetratricopeptide (TPR) repeat protein